MMDKFVKYTKRYLRLVMSRTPTQRRREESEEKERKERRSGRPLSLSSMKIITSGVKKEADRIHSLIVLSLSLSVSLSLSLSLLSNPALNFHSHIPTSTHTSAKKGGRQGNKDIAITI